MRVNVEVALLDEFRHPYAHFPPADWDRFSDQQLEKCASELVKRGCDMVHDTYRLCKDCDPKEAALRIRERLGASFVETILRGRYQEDVDSYVLA